MNRSFAISEYLLNQGLSVRITTYGPSMFPLIRTGDRVIIRPDKNPDVGDIIVFARDDNMICHRLIKIFNKDGLKYYQTRGDSFFNLDKPITAEQILGKVERVERGNVSLARKILLFVYPVLRFGRLNAMVISGLITMRNILIGKISKWQCRI